MGRLPRNIRALRFNVAILLIFVAGLIALFTFGLINVVTFMRESAVEPSYATVDEAIQAGSPRIILNGSASGNEVVLYWSAQNITDGGFMVVKSAKRNPTYPGSEYILLETVQKRLYKWQLTDGLRWHFRVCHVVDGACRAYSNDIEVTAPLGGKLVPGP